MVRAMTQKGEIEKGPRRKNGLRKGVKCPVKSVATI